MTSTTRGRPHDAHPAVEELLGRLGVSTADGDAQTLPHNRRLTPGVWRVRLKDGRSAVLKYLPADRDAGETEWDAHWTARDHDPCRWNHWAREPLAYEHRLTDVYAPAGLHAPACLAVHVGERDALLLLEWVDGEPGESWPVAAYGPAAEAVGRAQAPFLLGRSLPPYPWLSRGFLREYSTEKPVDRDLLDDEDSWRHPIAREVFPAGLRDGVRFVHVHRERLYRISESLPQTLCHLDLWPKNLIRTADERIVLVDWAFIGVGSVGEDAGNLVLDACFDHFVAADELPHLEQVVFGGYLRGLRSAGWEGDPRVVRLGLWASAVKYDWLAAVTLAQLQHEKQLRYGGEGEIDPLFRSRERGHALLFATGWARRAIELAEELGLQR